MSLVTKITTMLLDSFADKYKGTEFEWVVTLRDAINTVTWPLLIIVAAAGTIYAVVLGVNMARADSTEKREEAKKRVISVLVGMAIIIGLILLLKLFVESILPGFLPDVAESPENPTT